MTGAFITGALAGYAIAIPVGAIAVLILDTAIRHGFRVGAAAGAGAATADLTYATLAAVAGTALAQVIGPIQVELRAISVVVLVAIAVRGLAAVRADARGLVSLAGTNAVGAPDRGRGPQRGAVRRTYLRFVGLTIVNPATVVYFAALILGMPVIGDAATERAAFIVGVALASLSWQTVLASVGSLAHGRLSPRARLATSLLGNLIVLAFAANIARTLVAA